MNSDWWPVPLSYIASEKPWSGRYVAVAEIQSFDEKPHAGQRSRYSALVPIEQLDEISRNLAKLGHDVSTSGPHPSPSPGLSYVPRFWIAAQELPDRKYEPLVLSWSSHDKTILLPDPGFLMTYGLTPRASDDGAVSWDDPAEPVHDVVIVRSPSVWNFPMSTTAYVQIRRDYLQDYLTLRNMALVQVFWEMRWGETDETAERALGKEEAVDIGFADRLFQLNRDLEDKSVLTAQVWGARVLGSPGDLPISEDPLENKGLVWPGFPNPVTNDIASRMHVSDYVYVDDTVLETYEGRRAFRIHPISGSVSFGSQWSVGYCERVGRNLIRLELKKLYEGARPAVVRHWNEFAVEIPSREALVSLTKERNIAIRAEEITFDLVALGEALAAVAQLVGLPELNPENFVSLRRDALEYSGWWNFEETEAISRHVPLNCSLDMFLDRCLSLHKLIVEGLSEAKLRKLLNAIGVPHDSIAELGTLKLLDCTVRMTQVANATGLRLSDDGKRIWDRLEQDGTNPARPIPYLFALHDIRIIKAHKAADQNRELIEELKRFDVAMGQEAAGYGRILDRMYDALHSQLHETSIKIASAR